MNDKIIHYKRKRPIKNKTSKTVDNKTPEKQQSVLLNSENKKIIFFYPLIAIIITFAVYIPVFKNNFTNWDDTHYVLENHLIDKFDLQTLKKYFFSNKSYERYFMGNYHPLTMVSLNLSYMMASVDQEGKPLPFAFQAGNIFLHLISVLFVFLIAFKLLRNNIIAFLAALFFGIHALHTESVAWISERKDVLYAAFYFIALYLYILYVEKNKISYYIGALFVFFLSLLSKGQAVSLAPTLLLIDFWYDRKLTSQKVISEKIPFFILAIIFGLIAINAQKYGSALQEKENYALVKRFAIASYGFTMYLLKLLLPLNLSAIYPYPDIINKTLPAYFWLMLIPTGAVVYLSIISYLKKRKLTFFSLAFFIINIVLLLQIIPVGGAIYADRYSYIPSFGIHLLIASFIFILYENKKTRDFTKIFTIIYLGILVLLTIQRIGVWKNSLTLWSDTVKKQPKAVVAWNNYGSELNRQAKKYYEEKKLEQFAELKKQAIACFDKAIEQKPDYKSAFYNRATSIYELAKETNDTAMMRHALEDLNKALLIDPVFTEAFKQRGAIYDWLGEYEKAIADYKSALKFAPNDAVTYINIAVTYGKQKLYDLSIENLKKAIALNPTLTEAYSNLGLAYYYKQEYDKALEYLTKAINDNPIDAKALFNRSLVYGAQGKYKEAIEDLNRTIKAGRTTADVFYFRGIYEIYSGNTDEACKDLKYASELNFAPARNAWQKYCRK